MSPKELNDEKLHRIALTFIDGIGPKTARTLIEHFGSATDVFAAPVKLLTSIPGMGDARAKACKDAAILTRAEQELEYAEKNGVRLIFLLDDDYPERLKACADAPMLLNYKGNAPLDTAKMIAIVGTRKNTDYGRQLCEDLVDGLKKQPDVTIVSGLAHGIDAIAHRRCIVAGIPTIGVLAHGLDRLYPPSHRELAKEMQLNGGLLTEFPSGTTPERTNFPVRNRVVAGMCDVTVVVESDEKGGAMITGYLAAGYNREVAAFPGRVHDARSGGPLKLINMNIATMIRNADDLFHAMNWNKAKEVPIVQRQLLLALSDQEQKLVDALQGKEAAHADELLYSTGLTTTTLSSTLLQLEMQGIVRAMPGKRYRLN